MAAALAEASEAALGCLLVFGIVEEASLAEIARNSGDFPSQSNSLKVYMS